MTQTELYLKEAEREKAKLDAAHEVAMSRRRNYMASDPGGFNPWEKKAVENYFGQKEASRQFDEGQKTARGQWGFTDEDGEHHAGGAEKVAGNGYMGQRDAGAVAAQINAEAAKYGSDNTLKGIEAQAAAAKETAKYKAEADKWIAGRNAEVTEGGSQREWGYIDGNGNYVTGGRVRQAEAQGEAAAKVAEQNNQAKIEAERIKAQAKVQAQQLMKNQRIAAAIGGNVMLSRDPEKAKEMLEALAGAGMSEDEIAEIMEKRMKAAGQQGAAGNQPTKVNPKTKSINDRARELGGNMGV